jgi:hypothetical protein
LTDKTIKVTIDEKATRILTVDGGATTDEHFTIDSAAAESALENFRDDLTHYMKTDRKKGFQVIA